MKILVVVVSFFFVAPSFVFAQAVPLIPPAFMQNVKSQADFDKLTPEQQKEMKAFLENNAMAEFKKVSPDQEGQPVQPSANTIPAPEMAVAPRNGSLGIIMSIFFGVIVLGVVSIIGMNIFHKGKQN